MATLNQEPRRLRTLLRATVAASLACAAVAEGPRASGGRAAAAARAPAPPIAPRGAGGSGEAPPGQPAGRLHALLINGGGSAADNFASHVEHLRVLLDLLARAGVSRERIAVLASDGSDPAPDVAFRAASPEGAWLLGGTELGKRLQPGLTYETTRLLGVSPRPATRAALERWFAEARGRLRAGDTLLLYVTDHGTPGEGRRGTAREGGRRPGDPRDNRITLWGRNAISVRQMRALLERLPAGVRVVTVMSQCFSGGFAHLFESGARAGLPGGGVCGYFSTTADREAYGCFPESRGRERRGHSFELFAALEATGGALGPAHARVLVEDDTPDVPLRSSDIFLYEALARGARRVRSEETGFADLWLARARAGGGGEEPLAHAVARRFGLDRPGGIAALDARVKALEAQLTKIDESRGAWERAFDEAAEANLGRFLAAEPVWARQTAAAATGKLDEAARARLASDLLAALVPFTKGRGEAHEQLVALDKKAEAAGALAYRQEVRLAALLRLRALLIRAAARAYVEAERGDEAAAAARLERCEALTLPLPELAPNPEAEPPLPPVEEDERLAAALRPSFLGVQFRPARPQAGGASARAATGREGGGPVRSAWPHSGASGAVVVVSVQPGSPAAAAGLRAGDLVLGPPGQPFAEPHELNVWTKLAPSGRAAALELVRAGRPLTVTFTPAPLP